MIAFQILHLLATLLCTLVAGIVLSFSIVVMPGIKSLSDREFLQAFKVMDEVIQQKQPVFMLVWLGSIVALLALTWLGVLHLTGMGRVLLVAACTFYILGAQLPTITINIPLNNHIQSLDLFALDDASVADIRLNFEARWNQWNVIRTGCATFSCVLLLVLLALPALS